MNTRSVELASRGSRLGAAVLDMLVLVVPLAIAIFGATEDSPALAVLGGLATLGVLVYQIVLLSKAGQTLGKRWLDIRIVKVDTGENGGFVTNFLLRGLVNGLLGIIPPYGPIDTLFIFREDRRCIHDFIAGTRVVRR